MVGWGEDVLPSGPLCVVTCGPRAAGGHLVVSRAGLEPQPPWQPRSLTSLVRGEGEPHKSSAGSSELSELLLPASQTEGPGNVEL